MSAETSTTTIERSIGVANVQPSQAAGPKAVDDTALAALQLLLRVESEAREAKDLQALRFLVANETRKLTRARQIFVVDVARPAHPRVLTVSSVATTDRNSPLNQSVENLIRTLHERQGLTDVNECTPDEFENIGVLESYPLRQLVWVPFKSRSGQTFAGILQARETIWTERDLVVGRRLADAYAHAWAALSNRKEPGRRTMFVRKFIGITCAALAALMFVPVPMTALAPSEIVARAPGIVSAPVDGVIEKIRVEPNTTVKSGQILLSFADTALRNKYAIAKREVLVARARLKRANQLAFEDVRGRHELGIAQAELSLRIAERNYAKALLDKSVVRAQRDGIAVYRDKKDLVGKPVTTGEKLMAIADPSRVLVRINMPVSDGYILQTGADVKLFLDSDPLNPVRARITTADYEAKATDGTQVSFQALAGRDQTTSPWR